MTKPVLPRSPLWIVVLGLACEEPMHPYRMQTLITLRGKDQVANISQRNSVYQTINALARAGLIAVSATQKDQRRPERTLYAATPLGKETLKSWIRHGLATPAREFPEFPAVLSTLYGITGSAPLRALLSERVTVLEARLRQLELPYPEIPRWFLLEQEYSAALVRAELTWLAGLIADLKDGSLSFPSRAEILRISPEQGRPSESTLNRLDAEMQQDADPPKPQRRGARSNERRKRS